MNAYFLISLVILAILLFFPTSKLIWTVSVRRLQKKIKTELSNAELEGQLKRARIIAIFVVLIFSYLFNVSLGLRP
jgi:hypothetical protein